MPDGLKPHEVLERLLAQEPLTPDEVRDIVRTNQTEGQIEYKSGELLNESHKATELKKYLSAFGNIDGGVLIIGVGEGGERAQRFEINGCPWPEPKLREWPSAVMQSMSPSFSPHPKWQVVDVDGKLVLLIGIPRAPLLVYFVENGRNVYYQRIDHAASRIPDTLVADLQLGRRQHPVLSAKLRLNIDIPEESVEFRKKRYLVRFGRQSVRTGHETFRLENQSLVAVRNVQVGLIFWSVYAALPATDFVRMHIDARVPDQEGWDWTLEQRTAQADGVPIFEARAVDMRGVFTLPMTDARMRAALYVVPDSGLALWYQVDFDVKRGERPIACERVLTPPVVSYEPK